MIRQTDLSQYTDEDAHVQTKTPPPPPSQRQIKEGTERPVIAVYKSMKSTMYIASDPTYGEDMGGSKQCSLFL